MPNHSACSFPFLDTDRLGERLPEEVGAAEVEARGCRGDAHRTATADAVRSRPWRRTRRSETRRTRPAGPCRVKLCVWPGRFVQPPLGQAGALANRVRPVLDEQRPVGGEGTDELRDVLGGSQVIHVALGARVVEHFAGFSRGSVDLSGIGPSKHQEKSKQQDAIQFVHTTDPIHGSWPLLQGPSSLVAGGPTTGQGYLVVEADTLLVPNGRSMPAVIQCAMGQLLDYIQGYRNGDCRVAVSGNCISWVATAWSICGHAARSEQPLGGRRQRRSRTGGVRPNSSLRSHALSLQTLRGLQRTLALAGGVAYDLHEGTLWPATSSTPCWRSTNRGSWASHCGPGVGKYPCCGNCPRTWRRSDRVTRR